MTGGTVSAQTPASPDSGSTGSRSGLRTCLLVGVGCLALLAIALCIATAVFLPRARSIVQDFGSQIGIDQLQELENLTVPSDLLDEVLVVPTEAPDLCVESLCLSFPPEMGLEALVLTQPAQPEPDVWAVPEHVEIRFTTYPLLDKFHQPHISVFDVARFRQVNPNVGSILDELAALLVSRPATPESIPVVPIFNAAQMILSQVSYLDFEGGSGVRFVTQYGQAMWPINNHDLFYAFMGLSDDGQTLISAILPVTNAGLPDDPETLVGDDFEAFSAGYPAYMETTKAMLDSASPATFNPDLQALDALMQSIELIGAQ